MERKWRYVKHGKTMRNREWHRMTKETGKAYLRTFPSVLLESVGGSARRCKALCNFVCKWIFHSHCSKNMVPHYGSSLCRGSRKASIFLGKTVQNSGVIFLCGPGCRNTKLTTVLVMSVSSIMMAQEKPYIYTSIMFHDCSYVQGIKYQLWESNRQAAGSWSTPTQLLGIWACSHLSRTDATTWLNHGQPTCHCPTLKTSPLVQVCCTWSHTSLTISNTSLGAPALRTDPKRQSTTTSRQELPETILWKVVIGSFRITVNTWLWKSLSEWLRSDPSKALPPDTWLLQIAGAALHWAPKCRPWQDATKLLNSIGLK